MMHTTCIELLLPPIHQLATPISKNTTPETQTAGWEIWILEETSNGEAIFQLHALRVAPSKETKLIYCHAW